MVANLRRLAPPRFAHEEQTRAAALLNTILLFFLVATLLYGLATLLTAKDLLPRLVLVAIQIGILLLLYGWMQQGQIRRASLGLVAEFWLLSTVFTIYGGGFQSTSAGNYLVCIILASLLLGGRYAGAVAGLSILTRFALYWAGHLGLLPLAAFSSTPAMLWISESIGYGFATLLLWLAARGLTQALADTRLHAQALTASNQALQASEAFAQAIFHSVAPHIAVLDRQGAITAVNQAWTNFARTNGGVPATTSIGVNYLAVCKRTTGADASVALATAAGIQAVLDGVQPSFTLEYPCFSPTEERWFILSVTPLHGPQGGAVVSHINISDRKRAEQLLQQSEARYRALLEAIPDGIVWLRRDGVYLDATAPKAFAAVQPAALIGQTLHEILPPALAAKMQAHTEAALDSGQMQIYEFDLSVNGEQFVREARMVPINQDEVIVIIRDITQRKRAEAALRESEERYRTLVELAPDGIFVNRDNQIVYANPACVRQLGATTAAEILGHTPFDFIHPSGHAVTQERITKLLDQGGSTTLAENTFVRVDGALVQVEVGASAIQYQGERAIQVVWRDITARKQAEAELAKLLAEVSQQRMQMRVLYQRLAELQEQERKMLARELHDQVGANLSLLAVNLKLLQTEHAAGLAASDSPQARFKALQDLLQQVNSRVRDIMADLWPPVLDDYGLLAALEWYAARLATHSQLQITVQGDEPTPRPDPSVEQALLRIAQEALTNVVKHAQASQVTIRLTAREGALRLVILDNGRGMDPKLLNSPGHRQGWGLLNMRERAEAIGGQLCIDSQPGAGSEIVVQVPLESIKE